MTEVRLYVNKRGDTLRRNERILFFLNEELGEQAYLTSCPCA